MPPNNCLALTAVQLTKVGDSFSFVSKQRGRCSPFVSAGSLACFAAMYLVVSLFNNTKAHRQSYAFGPLSPGSLAFLFLATRRPSSAVTARYSSPLNQRARVLLPLFFFSVYPWNWFLLRFSHFRVPLFRVPASHLLNYHALAPLAWTGPLSHHLASRNSTALTGLRQFHHHRSAASRPGPEHPEWTDTLEETWTISEDIWNADRYFGGKE